MTMKNSVVLLFIICFCSSAYSQVDTTSSEYSNLILAEFEIDSTIILQDHRLSELLSKHIMYNENKKGIEGYRIQIFSGVGGSTKKEAMAVRTNFLKLYPDIPVEIIYDEPYFKVRVGLFRSKSEGYKLFKELLPQFPGSYFVIENEMEFPPL